ncbi:hypothetical protein [Methylobacterium planeticum]|uniref:Uncharacterized protein n=1 Tax=Methylobacterium planeticum TaxID=2615211 RepID=A0A6N6MQM5_9HYPH|nr:hypothetical protein [Methylobacterium planeticum]KAB1073003.1 hypothetical protein F6X51_13560 [Methylobacterium planeticum]
MEHVKSTLATATLAMFGLVAAAHILHPGNFDARTRRATPAVAVTEPAPRAPAWIDPPSRSIPATASSSVDARTTALDIFAPATSPVTFTLASTAASMPAPVTLRDGPKTERARKAVSTRRHRFARDAARQRQASVERNRLAGSSAGKSENDKTAVATERSKQVDLIGDLIRGLGLGSKSEG